MYGNLSGLRINTEKTKLIWIGSMQNSAKRLSINEEMCWGDSTFNLLGLQFSVNLKEIPYMNFHLAVEKAKSELKSWKYRTLSPFGKITVLKTLILPKFVHLLSSLPVPKSILLEINAMFYTYLWNGKPEKVKREVLCKDYREGGLKMINVINFEKALKLKWLKYNLLHKKQDGFGLVDIDVQNLENITVFGGEWVLKHCKALNPFWKDVFSYWREFCASQQIVSNNEISCSAIWYNKCLNTENIHFPSWSKKGINFVNDIIDTYGNVLSLQTLKDRFKLNINFLHYHTVHTLIKKYISKHKKGENFKILTPYIPHHLKPFIKSQQNKRAIYQSLEKSSKAKINDHTKWEGDLGLEIDNNMWRNIYKACFFTIRDNTCIWLQYRIIKRILGTNYYLKKTKISDSDLCRNCNKEIETLVHLFYDCNKVSILWSNIRHWIESKTNITLHWDKMMYTVGYSLCDANFYPLNFILMIVRQYIFKCALKQRELNIYQIQIIVKEKYLEQELLSKLNSDEDNFSKRWFTWKRLFSDI